jgi:hypothetical protein
MKHSRTRLSIINPLKELNITKGDERARAEKFNVVIRTSGISYEGKKGKEEPSPLNSF